MSLSIIHSAIHVCTVDKLVTLSPSVHQFNLPYCEWQDDVKSGVGRTRTLRRSNSVNLSMLTWLCTVISVQWRFPLLSTRTGRRIFDIPPAIRPLLALFASCPLSCFVPGQSEWCCNMRALPQPFPFFLHRFTLWRYVGHLNGFRVSCFSSVTRRGSANHLVIVQLFNPPKIWDYPTTGIATEHLVPTCHHFSSLGKCQTHRCIRGKTEKNKNWMSSAPR